VLLLAIILLGMVAGAIASLLVRGGGVRSINWPEAFIAGIAGSFVGGLLGSLLTGNGLQITPSGLIGSTVGAVLVLLGLDWTRRRSTTTS
jgi:uncharacterized membrane protein YeaQ/YmgE (transglycosylase-associated protein family)